MSLKLKWRYRQSAPSIWHALWRPVANPPFLPVERQPFVYEWRPFCRLRQTLAPRKASADFAFVQHDSPVDDKGHHGVCAVAARCTSSAVEPEGHIREYLIKEKNYLDAIGLPPNILRHRHTHLHYGGEEKAWVQRQRVVHRCQPALWKVKTQNFLRPQDIDKIVDTLQSAQQPRDKYSYVGFIERDYRERLQPEHTALCGHAEEAVNHRKRWRKNWRARVDMKAFCYHRKSFIKELGIDAPF